MIMDWECSKSTTRVFNGIKDGTNVSTGSRGGILCMNKCPRWIGGVLRAGLLRTTTKSG